MIRVAAPGPSRVTTSNASSTGGKHRMISMLRTDKKAPNPFDQPPIRPSVTPTTPAKSEATKATDRLVRAPQISRESTSRPNSSRPSQDPDIDPARRLAMSCRTGSGRGSSGAAIAVRTIKATMPPGSQRRRM